MLGKDIHKLRPSGAWRELSASNSLRIDQLAPAVNGGIYSTDYWPSDSWRPTSFAGEKEKVLLSPCVSIESLLTCTATEGKGVRP